MRHCVDCQADISLMHRNCLYCSPCRRERRRNPSSHMEPEQAALIDQLRNTMYRREIAQLAGVSEANVARYLREHGLRSNVRDYPIAVVQAVCTAYATMGTVRTQELFPEVRVRSIVERYYKREQMPPRQLRWTDTEKIDAARMAGLVAHSVQAAYFHRPGAANGSIKALWGKWFCCAPGNVPGLPLHVAWRIALPGVIGTLVPQQVMPGPRVIVLWLDLVGHLRHGVEPWIAQAITALAQCQAWLFGTTDSQQIRTMLTQREESFRI